MRDLRRGMLLIVVLAAAATVTSCKGSPKATGGYRHCRCGTVEHDILGCTAQCCDSVRWHCGNPDCTCEWHAAGGLAPAGERR